MIRHSCRAGSGTSTYHVTNVREDGSIPQDEPHHWEQLDTLRTNAQIIGGGGGVCRPEG